MKYLPSVWLTVLFLTSSIPLHAETDWTYWRGPRFDNVSTEKNLPDSWDPKGGDGSNVVWKQPIGTRSTPIIMQGRLYALSTDNPEEPQKTREKVVCLNADTGEVIWEYAFNVYLSDVPVERLGWSSVAGDPETGNVYALGVCGYFCCLNGETGEVVWDRSLHEEFGLLSTYGGRTNFPLIHENNVIISSVVIGWGDMAKPAHRFIAFDKTNGQPVWFEGTKLFPHDTTYSAPVLAVIGGELQMVFASGDGGVYGFQPRTGKKLWSYDLSGHGVNTSPLVIGDKVICGHSEENLDATAMGALVCLDATKRGDLRANDGVLWKTNELFVGRSSPVLIDGRLYAADDRAKLWCLNPDTGEILGKEVRLGTMMRANLLYADGKIYANEVNGRSYILKPTDTGAEITHQVRVRNEEFHGSPIAWKGRVYIPTTAAMYCIAKPDAEPAADELPPVPAESPRDEDMTPAQAQLVPVESLLRPGTRQEFHVRLYNAKGQYIRNANSEEIEFTLSGPGEMEKARYTIGRDQSAQAPVMVSAKVGELTAKARIRVIPDLPWSYNFDDGNIPMTWVGVQYRHVGLDFDLLSKLRAEDPRAADLYIYLHTAFTNFGPGPKSYADTTPKQDWTTLLRFLKLSDGADKPKTVDEAKEKLGPALQKLIDEKVLASVEWSTWDRPTGDGDKTVPEPKLTVTKGERKIDGNGVLCKISTIPLGTRSQGWTGHPDFHDYTIQSDIYAMNRDEKLPDIGLVAQRYTLDLMGASQKLQIRTWTPQLNRFSVDVPFEWQAETWYTMKFQTATEGGKAVLKGKVWKRGEPEPADWTVAGEDELGNVQGSPGFFGNAKDSEIFYDNLTVIPN
ncbi:MAG: PQQ-binding-like beta-propeller repeat protein [Planctomycetaceae bacterium]|nr:PQQ-binding-like beta-propeller repeat protein [Planctomycetaceae bacterium]